VPTVLWASSLLQHASSLQAFLRQVKWGVLAGALLWSVFTQSMTDWGVGERPAWYAEKVAPMASLVEAAEVRRWRDML